MRDPVVNVQTDWQADVEDVYRAIRERVRGADADAGARSTGTGLLHPAASG